MSHFVTEERRTAARVRSFPRTTAVLIFVLFSGLAQLQTVVNLRP